MKKQILQKAVIPEGVLCTYVAGTLSCKKDSAELTKKIEIPGVDVRISNNEVTLECKKGNKLKYKIIMSYIAHIKNLFNGLNEKFVYELDSCSVHFPMTLKTEGNKLTINNFLGEKTPRYAKILPNVDVEIKGQKIKIFSANRDAAGQTAANFEKATRIKSKDRRIYQDGIFITSKPGSKK